MNGLDTLPRSAPLVTLAIDPFVQQVAYYPLEQVYSNQNATMPVLLTSLGVNFKGPVYSALFNWPRKQQLYSDARLSEWKLHLVTVPNFGNLQSMCRYLRQDQLHRFGEVGLNM